MHTWVLRRRPRGRHHAVSRRTTHACAGHAVRTDYRVCAQADMTLGTCNVTDRLLVNVTPRILIICTRWSSGISSGIDNFVFRLWSVKIISWLFVKLSFRLLASAHSLTLCNSAEQNHSLSLMRRWLWSAVLLWAYFQQTAPCQGFVLVRPSALHDDSGSKVVN